MESGELNVRVFWDQQQQQPQEYQVSEWWELQIKINKQ